EIIEEHFLREGRASAETKKFQYLVFLGGEVHGDPADFDRLGIEIEAKITRIDDRLRMPFGAANDGVDARDQLVLVERLGHVVVGSEAEPAHLVLNAAEPGEDQYRGLHLRHPQRAQNLVPGHVGKVQIEQYDIVI